MENYPNKKAKELMSAIAKLETTDEAVRFFRDLLTPPEINEFANRFQIAKRVYQGKSYAEIAKELGVSTTTVTRVALWLNHGMDGYRLILDRLMKKKP
ncbi:helix-turn-helix domain-containing protein [Candidatus Roizmanbacteria bacterium]|nr:helix-turn-helix domain-containing protein [Candidatus Roizmanbacteria bacterium]